METVYIVFGSHKGCLKEYILGCFKDAVSAFNFKEKYEQSEDCAFSLLWVNSFLVD